MKASRHNIVIFSDTVEHAEDNSWGVSGSDSDSNSSSELESGSKSDDGEEEASAARSVPAAAAAAGRAEVEVPSTFGSMCVAMRERAVVAVFTTYSWCE